MTLKEGEHEDLSQVLSMECSKEVGPPCEGRVGCNDADEELCIESMIDEYSGPLYHLYTAIASMECSKEVGPYVRGGWVAMMG